MIHRLTAPGTGICLDGCDTVRPTAMVEQLVEYMQGPVWSQRQRRNGGHCGAGGADCSFGLTPPPHDCDRRGGRALQVSISGIGGAWGELSWPCPTLPSVPSSCFLPLLSPFPSRRDAHTLRSTHPCRTFLFWENRASMLVASGDGVAFLSILLFDFLLFHHSVCGGGKGFCQPPNARGIDARSNQAKGLRAYSQTGLHAALFLSASPLLCQDLDSFL